jgi:hypothetical protein
MLINTLDVMNTKPGILPSELKRLSRWVKLFIWATVIGGLLTIMHGLHVRYDPGAARHYGRVAHVHIGGRDFAVPGEYIRGPLPTEANAKQLYIWLTLPNYEPYKGDFIEEESPVPIGYRHLIVLIDDTASATDLAVRYNARRNGPESIFTPKDTADLYGLHRTFVWYANPRFHDTYITSDLYHIEDARNEIATFVACGVDKPPPQNPMCEHFFQDGRLIYKVAYSKKSLAQWHEIETRVHSLVDSFSCEPANIPDISTIKKGLKPCPP